MSSMPMKSRTAGVAQASGTLTLVKHGRAPRIVPASLDAILQYAMPRRGLPSAVNTWRVRNLPNILREAKRLLLARMVLGTTMPYGALWHKVVRGDGQVLELGLASLRLVTDLGVAYIIDAMQNITEAEAFKYHGWGVGTTAEAANQTALVTELTTEYVGNTRVVGTQIEGATANIYRSAATLAPDSGGVLAITEHGLFSAAAAGTMLDRSKFAAVNLDSANGDQLTSTYDFTLPSGG